MTGWRVITLDAGDATVAARHVDHAVRTGLYAGAPASELRAAARLLHLAAHTASTTARFLELRANQEDPTS